MRETIFAEATAPGRAGVSVIRVSGPKAIAAIRSLTSSDLPPRRAALRCLRGEDGAPIDDAVVIAFPAPNSFTGEDVVELQCHGSRAVILALLRDLAARPGLRIAEPGEFTRRALENGRLDLAQVEGLSDLLVAETEAQRRQAMTLMQGTLSALAAGWRDRLVHALAYIEATIDFADEDVPECVLDASAVDLAAVAAEMEVQLAGAAVSERLRHGFEVALVGAPNVGKSSLINALAGRSVAITSPVPGTTRDVIELRTDLRGLPVTFLDTAGVRRSEDPVEREGVSRALARAEAADLRLFLDDGLSGTSASETHFRDGDMIVQCKADLRSRHDGLAVSSVTGLGINELLERIGTILSRRTATATAPSHARQREAIARSRDSLVHAGNSLRRGGEPEVAAAEIHAALRSLDFLVGRVDVESVLDIVFQSFCLGK